MINVMLKFVELSIMWINGSVHAIYNDTYMLHTCEMSSFYKGYYRQKGRKIKLARQASLAKQWCLCSALSTSEVSTRAEPNRVSSFLCTPTQHASVW